VGYGILFYTGPYRIEDTEGRNIGLACVLTGFAVSWIIYIPVCDYIHLFRFSPADILSVVFRLG
jgi:hypothetical protein